MEKRLKNYDLMQNFTLKNIPSLDTCVLGALEFLQTRKLPKIDIPKTKRILVVGSGNALSTGRILFKDYDAIFADESNYKSKLKIKFDLAVIISASGEKHAPLIAKSLKIKKILLTTNPNSSAQNFVDKTVVFPKQKEPYTYNTSTYLSLILSKTKESPKKIISRLNRLKISGKYDSYYFILPSNFEEISEMIRTKFDELFGPKIVGRSHTEEQTKHAKTVVPSEKELFITFGENKILKGRKQIRIKLSTNPDYGELISICYYLIGKIQSQKKNYFKENIEKYCKEASKVFKSELKPIVE